MKSPEQIIVKYLFFTSEKGGPHCKNITVVLRNIQEEMVKRRHLFVLHAHMVRNHDGWVSDIPPFYPRTSGKFPTVKYRSCGMYFLYQPSHSQWMPFIWSCSSASRVFRSSASISFPDCEPARFTFHCRSISQSAWTSPLLNTLISG